MISQQDEKESEAHWLFSCGNIPAEVPHIVRSSVESNDINSTSQYHCWSRGRAFQKPQYNGYPSTRKSPFSGFSTLTGQYAEAGILGEIIPDIKGHSGFQSESLIMRLKNHHC